MEAKENQGQMPFVNRIECQYCNVNALQQQAISWEQLGMNMGNIYFCGRVIIGRFFVNYNWQVLIFLICRFW